MTQLRVMVPVLTLLDRHGRVDRGATTAYAQRAQATWLDHFLVSGSLGLGFTLTQATRMELLEIWLDNVDAHRVLGCAWGRGEADEIGRLGATPMAVLQKAETDEDVLDQLRPLPKGSYVYSHPQYTTRTLTTHAIEQAQAEGVLPAGAKVSKVDLDELWALSTTMPPDFALYDGRSRYLQRSLDAGATGVVAVPLAPLPDDLPPRNELDPLQTVIDRTQALVDAHSEVGDQARTLQALSRLALRTP